MKKKLMTLVIGVCTVAMLAGCSSKKLSNDYITLKEYKGVEVEKQETEEVTDEDVEARVQETLAANMISTEITDRGAENGDVIVFDYEGKIDGTAFDRGSATDQQITLGAGGFIPGFEEGLVGHKAGETFDVPVTFPEEYQDTEKAGKDAVFTMTIKTVSEQTEPELTDDFVKSVSEESKTVDEYQKEVKKTLEEEADEAAKSILSAAAISEVVESAEVKKYPKDRVEENKKMIRSQYEQMATLYGMEFADFIEQQMQMTEEDFDAQAEEAAKIALKEQLAIELIAKNEKLEPTDKELEEAMQTYSDMYGYADIETFKANIGEDLIKQQVIRDNVGTWLVENCKQVEKKADESNDETEKSDDSEKEENTSEE